MSYTEPIVYYFRAFGDPLVNSDRFYVDGVRCYQEWNRFFFLLKENKVWNDFKVRYEKEKIDMTFAHSLFSNGYISWKAKREWGIPYIVYIQNTDINVFFKWRVNLRKLGIQILLDADKIIFASNSYFETLIAKYVPIKYKEIIQQKSQIIPYGIEEIFYEIRNPAPISINTKITVIAVGLITRNKNQLNLCKAIKKLVDKGYIINLILIGKVRDKQYLKKILKYDFVEYYSYMKKRNLIEFYQKSNIFALVSHTETFGLVYAEALSQGLPIIYTKGQGFDNQFSNGRVGYHVNCNDIDEIADTLQKVIEKYPDLRNNTLICSEKFRWKNVSEAYHLVYDQVVIKKKEKK